MGDLIERSQTIIKSQTTNCNLILTDGNSFSQKTDQKEKLIPFIYSGVVVPRKIISINQVRHPNLLDDFKRNKNKSIQSLASFLKISELAS